MPVLRYTTSRAPHSLAYHRDLLNGSGTTVVFINPHARAQSECVYATRNDICCFLPAFFEQLIMQMHANANDAEKETIDLVRYYQ